MTTVGRLEPVPLRTIWPNEAADFTPWLADNLDALSQTVGLALELRQREYPIGRYSLDPLLEDAQGRVVIVENQLEQTDHGHLGQLLTYCAGATAEVVIWIAQSITAEHAAALEWLNENTVAGVGFFGIELETLKIGDSVPAPNLKLVVRPNNWSKTVRPSQPSPVAWTWDRYVSEMRIPQERVAIGRQLTEALVAAIEQRDLPWQPVMNKGYVAIQRAGGYNVVTIDLYWNRAPRLAGKFPDTPDRLGLPNPFPALPDLWTPAEREWGWTVSTDALPLDVGALIDLVRPFQPASGPMVPPSNTGENPSGPER